MLIELELDVFSGVQNPNLILNDSEADALVRLLKKSDTVNKEVLDFDRLGLGYRGFIIRIFEGQETNIYRVFSEYVQSETTKELFNNSDIESLLLEIFYKEIDADLKQDLDQSIPNAYDQLDILGPPVYNPAKWNSNAHIQANNNCYNYVADMITNTFAQPGRAGGRRYSKIECWEMHNASKRDGWAAVYNPIDGDKNFDITNLLIFGALFLRGNQDFHWYRRDEKTWSHKPGKTKARNTDNSGNLIADPRTCNAGPYKVCVFFYNLPRPVRVR